MTTLDSHGGATSAGDGGWLSIARPALRPAVRVGPALLKGTGEVHIVGDRETGAFVRVGPREAFLMRHLDGKNSLHEITESYAQSFGRRLAPQHWQQLLGLLSSHALLDPANPVQLRQIRERAEKTRRAEGRGPLLWRAPIPGAVAMVPPAARWLGWLLHPAVAVPLTALGTVISVLVLLHLPTLYLPIDNAPSPLTLSVVSLLITWAVIGCHEIGHGVACYRYGGRPTEIGVMWRFPMVVPYCKIDDVVTFSPARRLVTAFAGIYVNLAALTPFAALWLWSRDSVWWHGLASALLIFGTAMVLVNLVPVLKLDGYHLLEHATSTVDLQSESFRFAAALLRAGFAGIAGYPRRARRIYSCYAVLAAVILFPALVLLVWSWFGILADLWNPVAAALILLAEAAVVAAFLTWATIRRGRGPSLLSRS
ncbi:MAG: hypothetical protein ACRDTA_16280 [Pseudonocardiaceae bacterium]